MIAIGNALVVLLCATCSSWPHTAKYVFENIFGRMGRDDDKRWNRKLRDMIITGAAKPSKIVSHHLTFDDAPMAFRKFDAREDGYIKVILRPR